MPPNSDVPPTIDPEAFPNVGKTIENRELSEARSGNRYNLEIFQSSLNLLAHILTGMVIGVPYLFALRSFPLTATPLHIVLCVSGYQLLMGQAILSLSGSNGWSQKLSLLHKRRAHWILQIAGSGLAIAGSLVKIIDKSTHWTTPHGQFALVALVFTSVSLVNGLTSLYAYELRGVLPGTLSKLTHICFGTVAFTAACCTLCFAFDKPAFQAWSTEGFGKALIWFTGALNFIIIINPVLTFFNRAKSVMKNK